MVDESSAARMALEVLKLLRVLHRYRMEHEEGRYKETVEKHTSANLMKNLTNAVLFFASISSKIVSATHPVIAVLSEVTAFTFGLGIAIPRGTSFPASRISSAVIAQYNFDSIIVSWRASSKGSKSSGEMIPNPRALS